MIAEVLSGQPHDERAPSLLRGVLASYATVTSSSDNRRSTDAAGITFSLQLVIMIVAGIIGTTGAFWVATAALRSDVRDILTRMEDRVKNDDLRDSVQKEQYTEMNQKLLSQQRQYELLRLEFQQLREQMLFGAKPRGPQ